MTSSTLLMNRNESLRAALVFLDSRAPLYPGGIPKAAVVRALPQRDIKLLHFLGAIGAAGKSVLDAAIVQGLKIDPASTVVSTLSEKDRASSAKLQQFVDSKIEAHPAHVVVLMGKSLSDALLESETRDAADEDGFVAYKGVRALLTEDLADVASNAQAKKRFWNELKKARDLFAKKGLA